MITSLECTVLQGNSWVRVEDTFKCTAHLTIIADPQQDNEPHQTTNSHSGIALGNGTEPKVLAWPSNSQFNQTLIERDGVMDGKEAPRPPHSVRDHRTHSGVPCPCPHN